MISAVDIVLLNFILRNLINIDTSRFKTSVECSYCGRVCCVFSDYVGCLLVCVCYGLMFSFLHFAK
jgi:hypothetical protein